MSYLSGIFIETIDEMSRKIKKRLSMITPLLQGFIISWEGVLNIIKCFPHSSYMEE